MQSIFIWWLRNFTKVNKVSLVNDATYPLTYWSQSVNRLVLHWRIILQVVREKIQGLRSSLIRTIINLHDYIISAEQISIPRAEPLWCFQSYWPRSWRLRNDLSLTKINERELFPFACVTGQTRAPRDDLRAELINIYLLWLRLLPLSRVAMMNSLPAILDDINTFQPCSQQPGFLLFDFQIHSKVVNLSWRKANKNDCEKQLRGPSTIWLWVFIVLEILEITEIMNWAILVSKEYHSI